MSDKKLTEAILNRLQCPICKQKLTLVGENLTCSNAHTFPVVNGVPVLINESNSLFNIAEIVASPAHPRQASGQQRLRQKFIPAISLNVHAERNYRDLAARLDSQPRPLHILIVGGGTKGEGMDSILALPNVTIVDTDIQLGANRNIVCDGHDLPFEDETFDAVIIQAVLEHVLDPYRCVAEIHRILKPNGLVYGETPFIQQGHLGAFDFTRFTHLGHRRLFRNFTEIQSGAVCGPGMALAWSYRRFWFSLFNPKRSLSRMVLGIFTDLTCFWLKYLDKYIIDIDNPNAIISASAYAFLGQKSDHPISDAELIKGYRGI